MQWIKTNDEMLHNLLFIDIQIVFFPKQIKPVNEITYFIFSVPVIYRDKCFENDDQYWNDYNGDKYGIHMGKYMNDEVMRAIPAGPDGCGKRFPCIETPSGINTHESRGLLLIRLSKWEKIIQDQYISPG